VFQQSTKQEREFAMRAFLRANAGTSLTVAVLGLVVLFVLGLSGGGLSQQEGRGDARPEAYLSQSGGYEVWIDFKNGGKTVFPRANRITVRQHWVVLELEEAEETSTLVVAREAINYLKSFEIKEEQAQR
jgi:hypothetical protein